MYLGQLGKGFVILGAAIGSYFVVPSFDAVAICIIATIDAFQVGTALRSDRPVGK